MAALRDASLRIESGIWFLMKRFGGCFGLLAVVGSESSMLYAWNETKG